MINKIQAAKPDRMMSALVGGTHVSFYRQYAATAMNSSVPIASTPFGVGNEHTARERFFLGAAIWRQADH